MTNELTPISEDLEEAVKKFNKPKILYCPKCNKKHVLRTNYVICICGEIVIYEQAQR